VAVSVSLTCLKVFVTEEKKFLGHLERRVSFGYDADLAQVRAEFDGEYLRVTVPRRITPMTYMEAQLS
jgi:hypothetical protein